MRLTLLTSLVCSTAAFTTQSSTQPSTALFAAPAKKTVPVKKAVTKPVVKKAVVKPKVVAKKIVAKAPIKKVLVKKSFGGSAVADFTTDIGATLPLGFFDPLGLVADGDQSNFDRLRLVELKHGRTYHGFGVFIHLDRRYGSMNEHRNDLICGESFGGKHPSLTHIVVLSRYRHFHVGRGRLFGPRKWCSVPGRD
jgi:Chlorophyll A-B binding protein